MTDHKNGWPIIAEHLRRYALRQSDLARMLGISPSAITQLKQESYLLNFRQLSRLAEALNLAETEHLELYRMIFRARREGRVKPIAMQDLIPVSAEILTAYFPALEPLDQFLCRCTGARGLTQVLVVFASGEPPGDPVIRLLEYPVPGDVVLAMLSNGELMIRRFLRGDDGAVILRDEWQKRPTVYCLRNEINSRIFWLRPVVEIIPKKEKSGENWAERE